MPHKYQPEGRFITDSENYHALSSLSELTRAIERRKILESVAMLCDSDYNLHFDLFGVPAIMPRSEVQHTRKDEEIKDIAILTRVGKPVSFHITGIRKEENGRYTALLSRKTAQIECMEEYISTLCPGDIIPATVTHLENFGAFVDIGCGIISLLSIDSISVSRISHPRDRLSVGDRIFCVVKSIDDAGRIYVSQRELYGTWEENAALFHQGETVAGIIRSIESYGIFVELAPNLAGLAEKKEGVFVNQTAAVYIKSILKDKMKVKLVIIDAQNKSEKASDPKYFIDPHTVSHIDAWHYSTPTAPKQIETFFTEPLRKSL